MQKLFHAFNLHLEHKSVNIGASLNSRSVFAEVYFEDRLPFFELLWDL